MLKYMFAVGLSLVAAPAFAQSGSTASPPAPLSEASGPQSANSVPKGAETMNPSATPFVGGAVSTTTSTAPTRTQTAEPTAGPGGKVSEPNTSN